MKKLSLFFLLIAFPAHAANVYVDDQTSADCTGNYSIANRSCTGTDGNSWSTIQEAITNCTVGDVIYMRGGTYSEIAIDIPETKNGTAWTTGNFTTLMSYPGEWAIVDGTGLNTASHWTDQAVFSHPTGYGAGESTEYTSYWKFSNFEVTGGRTGFFLKADHIQWRYMYIHDNGRLLGSTDTLVAGILSVCPRYAVIEYCYFKDNIQTDTPDMNNANILFDSDYKDSAGDGGAFDPDASTHHNIVRYNYMVGSKISLRQKNQQRFGLNSRDPDTLTYKDYGDQWHHNIILDAAESIGASQDFIQIYNNITDSTINFGRVSGSTGDIPQIYNGVIYNNTVKRDATDSSYSSFITSGGYSTDMYNFYDALPQRTIHEHAWFLNNISSNNSNTYQDLPFMFHQNYPANVTNPDQDNSDLIVNRNLIYANSNSDDFYFGHNYDAGFTGCDNQVQTLAEANSCMSTWTGSTKLNWDNSTAGLFLDTSGADQYKVDPTFVLDGSYNTADGGANSSHPYISGVTIPSYIGAVNPDDDDWVAGVMALDATYFTTATDDPTWVEGFTAAILPGGVISGGVVRD